MVLALHGSVTECLNECRFQLAAFLLSNHPGGPYSEPGCFDVRFDDADRSAKFMLAAQPLRRNYRRPQQTVDINGICTHHVPSFSGSAVSHGTETTPMAESVRLPQLLQMQRAQGFGARARTRHFGATAATSGNEWAFAQHGRFR